VSASSPPDPAMLRHACSQCSADIPEATPPAQAPRRIPP
jgi:hypothetical protein